MTDEPDIWSDQEVENLNRFQRFGMFHPFTCGTKEKHPSVEHPSGWTEALGENLVATRKGWRCTVCDYQQDWAHENMLKFTQEQADKVKEHYRKLMPGTKIGEGGAG